MIVLVVCQPYHKLIVASYRNCSLDELAKCFDNSGERELLLPCKPQAATRLIIYAAD